MTKAPTRTITRSAGRPAGSRRFRRHKGLGLPGTLTLVLLLVVGATACGEDGPSGPGTLEATVTAPEGTQLGAAALRLSGEGIQSIDESGDTRLFVSSISATDYRVVLVDPTPGTLTFDVQVADLAAAPPSVTINSAADGGNEPLMTLGEVRVRFTN